MLPEVFCLSNALINSIDGISQIPAPDLGVLVTIPIIGFNGLALPLLTILLINFLLTGLFINEWNPLTIFTQQIFLF